MNGDYNAAVHALVLLAHCKTPLASDELASNICTNAARVRKIMAPLRRAGLVKAREGREGGYRLAQSADLITLAQVAQALGVRFVSCSWSSGDTDMECVVASGMADAMDEIYDELDALCKKRLKSTTIADVERQIASTV